MSEVDMFGIIEGKRRHRVKKIYKGRELGMEFYKHRT